MQRFHSPCLFEVEKSSAARDVEIVPCTLVFLDPQALGSPNSRSRDPMNYVAQAITLNRSLLAAGLPRLTIVTNAADVIDGYLSNLAVQWRPEVRALHSSLELAKSTRFYAAHFKIDLLEEMAVSLLDHQLLLLLDTDVIARHALETDLLKRCHAAGVGAFDITDQEFSAYGARRVIADLEQVAGRTLQNPRWFGGEFLLATRAFIGQLVPVARACFSRYRDLIPDLNHQGDEVFISAALNILSEEGHALVEAGAHRAIGRHWSGNTHRDLRWFKACAFLHLPDQKTELARLARRRTFNANKMWRAIVVRHELHRIVWLLRLRFRPYRHRAGIASLLDVLLIDYDSNRLSSLARPLTSRGLIVMCAGPNGACKLVRQMHPKVVVIGSPLPLVEVAELSAETGRPSIFIGNCMDQTEAQAALWSRFFHQITDMPVMVDAITEAVEQAS